MVGTGVAVAHAIGAKNENEIRRTVHTAIPAALICGLMIATVGIVLTDPLLSLVNTPGDLLDYSATYMRIYFIGSVFMMVYNVAASVLRSVGDTKTPLFFLMMSGVLNVLLNVLFITVFDMKIGGVALATAISQAVSAILVLVVLARRTDACKFRLSKARIYKQPFAKILRIGIPAGLQNSLFSISGTVFQYSINSFGQMFGSTLIAGNAAAGNIEGFMHVVVNSFMQAAVAFVGQNTGAKNYERVKKVFVTCLWCVIVAGLAISALVYLFGPSLLSVYADTDEAIRWGMMRLGFICATYVLCGMLEVTTGSLRGLGMAMVPMITSVLGICGIRVLWSFLVFHVPALNSPKMLYLCYPISWGITFIVQAIALYFVYKKKKNESKMG